MRAVRQLIAEERYREARGILESEPDIDPRVAEKWLAWLADVQRAERVELGAKSDKAKRQTVRTELGPLVGGLVGVMVAAAAAWLLARLVLTHDTSSYWLAAAFVLPALLLGIPGWRWALHLMGVRAYEVIGSVMPVALTLFLLTSGFPLWFFYDPPLHYLLAAFALVFPSLARGGWSAGYRLLRRRPVD